MVSRPPQTAWSFDSYAGLHSFHTSSCPDLPKVDLLKVSHPRVVNARNTASCQPGASCSSQMGTLLVWKLVHQHYFFISSQGTALMETGFTHNFICKGMHPNRPSGIQYHFCVLCGPDRQACLCTALCPTHLSLCQKHLIPGNGLKASGAHRGTFRTPPTLRGSQIFHAWKSHHSDVVSLDHCWETLS